MNNFDNIKILKIERKGLSYLGSTEHHIATIELYKGEKLVNRLQVRYFDGESIYQMIEKGVDINLNNSLVIDFNLDKYREKNSLPSTSIIEIKNLTAQNTIFFSDKEINFHRASFTNQVANFSDAYFIATKINFREVDFRHSEENFHSCVFKAQEIDFSGSIFGENYHDFRNSIFEGKKILKTSLFCLEILILWV